MQSLTLRLFVTIAGMTTTLFGSAATSGAFTLSDIANSDRTRIQMADASQYDVDPSAVEQEEEGEPTFEDIDEEIEADVEAAPPAPIEQPPVRANRPARENLAPVAATPAQPAQQARVTTLSTSAALAKLGGDVKRGKIAAKACTICHSFKAGEKSKDGPNLYKVFGRKVGKSQDFGKYSKAMRNHNGVWTLELLDCYLKKPKKCIPGSNMAFGGLANDKLRRDVMSYLLTATSDE